MNNSGMIVAVLALSLASRLIAEPPRSGAYSVDGYGYVVSIEKSDVVVYDVSSASRLPFLRGRMRGDGTAKLAPTGGLGLAAVLTGNSLRAKFDGDSLSMLGSRYTLTPMPGLPDAAVTGATKNPAVNYDVFCRYVAEYSVAFAHRPNLDWAALCGRNRAKAESADPDELFAILSGMIRELNDGHTSLSAGSKTSESVPPSAFADELSSNGSSVFITAAKARLEAYAGGDTRRVGWGRIRGTHVGYLIVSGLMDMGSGRMTYDEEMSLLSRDLARAAECLSACDAVILDLRVNGGGYDGAAKKVASLFVESTTRAYSKQHRLGALGIWSPPEWNDIVPAEKNCARVPLAILVSPVTASAAEVLALSLLGRPDAAVIGERTSGCYSDALMKTLPNGWTLTLSNERYLDSRGVDREQVGIEPDIAVPVRYSDFAAGRDPCVDRALQWFAERATARNWAGEVPTISPNDR